MLTDIVTNISPTVTPLLSGLQTGPDAAAVLHEFLVDSFAAAADNAQAEAPAFTVVDEAMPTRANNLCQIFLQNVQVSRTMKKINSGVKDPFAYQIMKNMKEHAKDKSSMSFKNPTKSVKPNHIDLLTRIVRSWYVWQYRGKTLSKKESVETNTSGAKILVKIESDTLGNERVAK